MLADVWSYLTDGANWSGAEGIATYLLQQVLHTFTSLLIALLIGLPVALGLGHVGRGGVLAINISNVGRAIPTFAVLVLLSVGLEDLGTQEIGPYGRAAFPTLVALILFALPPIVTNAYVGMREVDREIIEAANGMGMRGWQVFREVELPLALPLILTGVRLAVVQVWATATIAALVAGPGLGRIITEGVANKNTPQVVSGALLVAVFALILEVVVVGLERVLDPVRRARRVSVRFVRSERGPADSAVGSST
ncbi:MAG: ABC transporter permease subunit [Propionibacteriales bacterium]|nr:ABC transporter permease subunit [Propionibacteriales bacterium]